MKKGKLIFLCTAFLLCLEGCTGKGEQLSVHIFDGYTETRLDVKEGITVGNALENAEIQLGDMDGVVPSIDTKITEDNTDISIKREKDADEITKKEGTDDPTDDNDKSIANIKDAKEGTENESQVKEDAKGNSAEEPEIVSKEKVYDCDGSGHGYYYIKWSDGSEEYEDF